MWTRTEIIIPDLDVSRTENVMPGSVFSQILVFGLLRLAAFGGPKGEYILFKNLLLLNALQAFLIQDRFC